MGGVVGVVLEELSYQVSLLHLVVSLLLLPYEVYLLCLPYLQGVPEGCPVVLIYVGEVYSSLVFVAVFLPLLFLLDGYHLLLPLPPLLTYLLLLSRWQRLPQTIDMLLVVGPHPLLGLLDE